MEVQLFSASSDDEDKVVAAGRAWALLAMQTSCYNTDTF